MKNIGKIILAGMVLCPSLAFAVADCRVNEFPDRYEVVCIGDGKTAPELVQTIGKTPLPAREKAPDTVPTPETTVKATTETPIYNNPQTSSATKSQAVKVFQDYIQREMQTSRRDAARAMRIKTIQEERQKQLDAPNTSN
jgi:hypothetical protein